MSFVSSSFEDFLEAFKKRHPKEYGLDSGRYVAVKAPMAKVEEKNAPAPVSVPMAVVVEEDWDAAEVVEVEESENWWDR